VTRTKSSVDPDGVRIVETAGVRTVVRLLGATAIVVAVVTALAVAIIRFAPARRAPDEATNALPASPPPALAAGPVGDASGAPSHPPVDPPGERPRRVRAARVQPPATSPGAELSAKDVIPMLRAAGEREGIAAFPPPGTKPVKRGIVVPEDFELPEGYVRHHQTTDDGQQLPPILMFHPDYQFLDEHGAPVPLPEDRVVPPDMAPPGLPIQMLDPAPAR
jgi:hypothetical protein